MRKLILGAALALALPAAALAEEGAPSPEQLATTACKTEKAQMGTKTFKKTYAVKATSRAMKLCLAKAGVVAEDAVDNAAHDCMDKRDSIGDEAFAKQYGTEESKGRNAFGKCVSQKAKAKVKESAATRVAASETCKSLSKEALQGTYGTEKNAFGKCVSKTAKELAEAEQA